MKYLVIPVLSLAICSHAAAQKTKPAVKKPAPAPVLMKNLLDSFSYAAGYNIALNMKDQGVTQLNTALVQRALNDVFQEKTPLLNNDYVNISLQKKLKEFAAQKEKALKAPGVAFLEANKKKPGIHTLPSGLQYEVLIKGDTTSKRPGITDTVVVSYAGSLIDGTEFDNSAKRGKPATFPLNGVIAGWTEILQLMNTGAKWKVYIPTELAYDMNPRDPKVIPPGSVLVFEMMLEEIKPAQKHAGG